MTVTKRVVPAVPKTDKDIRRTIQIIRANHLIDEGKLGDPLDRRITFRDLFQSGLVQRRVGVNYVQVDEPTGDFIAVPAPGATPVDTTQPPALTGLVATAAFQRAVLTWTGTNYANHSLTRIYRSTTDDFGTAAIVAEVAGEVWADSGLTLGVTYYYWITGLSVFFPDAPEGPVNAVAGVEATPGQIGTTDLADEIVTAAKIADGSIDLSTSTAIVGELQNGNLALIEDAAKIGSSVIGSHTGNLVPNASFEAGDQGWEKGGGYTIIETAEARTGAWAARYIGSSVTALKSTENTIQVSPGDRVQGHAFFKTTSGSGGQQARITFIDDSGAEIQYDTGPTRSGSSYEQSRVVATAPANAVAVEIHAVTVPSGTFTAYADGFALAVTSKGSDFDLSDLTGQIATSQIVAQAITSDLIASNAVVAGKIATGTIIAGDGIIANGAITNALIGTAAVDSARIASAAITEAKIASLAVTAAKIASAAITEAKIGTAAVTSAKIASAAITEAKILDAAVDTLKIRGNAVMVPVYDEYVNASGRIGLGITSFYDELLGMPDITVDMDVAGDIVLFWSLRQSGQTSGPFQYHVKIIDESTGTEILNDGPLFAIDQTLAGTLRVSKAAGSYAFHMEWAANSGSQVLYRCSIMAFGVQR